jgi:uncharacterized protein
MGYLDQFRIPFKGLSLGEHEYEFQINDTFFEQEGFTGSEIKNARVQVKLRLDKQETMLVLYFDIEANIGLECDRCLNAYTLPVKSEEKLIVKFDDTPYDETDDILVLNPSDTHIDIAQPIYEYVNLLVPYQRIPCETNGDKSMCDQEVLNKLNEHAPNAGKIDSRWDALKNLKLKD